MTVLNLYYVQILNDIKTINKYQFNNIKELNKFLNNDFNPFFFDKLTLQNHLNNEIDLVYSLWKGNHNFSSLGFPDFRNNLDSLYEPKPINYHITQKGYSLSHITYFFIMSNLKKEINLEVEKQNKINSQKFLDLKLKLKSY